MTPCEEFDIWMQAHNNNYLNDLAVLINRMPEFVLVESPWPDHGDALTLSIAILCTNGRELFELLDIETCSELDQLNAEDLLHSFYSGNAMVFCSIEDHACLRFQKIEHIMTATIDGDDLIHEVKEQLIVPGDFYRYTAEYFRLVKEIRHPGKNNS